MEEKITETKTNTNTEETDVMIDPESEVDNKKDETATERKAPELKVPKPEPEKKLIHNTLIPMAKIVAYVLVVVFVVFAFQTVQRDNQKLREDLAAYNEQITNLKKIVSENNAKLDELQGSNDELSRQINEERQEFFIWMEKFQADLIELEKASQVEVVEAGSITEHLPEGVLSKYGGVNWFEGHKETYYNLPMEGVINIARSKGNFDEYEYAVREDGVKTFGDYVMCAANYTVHPYGSIIHTSLGDGIVLDTGGFALTNPEAIDIAVNW